MERDAIRPLEYGGGDVPGRRQPGREDQGRGKGGLGLGERGEPDLLRDPLGDQPGSPLAEARAGRRILRSVVGGQQEWTVSRPAGQLRDDLQTQVVGPLQVFERQHRRARQRLDDALDDIHDKPTSLHMFGGQRRIAQIQQLAAQTREGNCLGHGTGHVQDRGGGHVPILGGD